MNILVIDFESQGSDPAVDLPTEVGAVLIEVPDAGVHGAMQRWPTTAFAEGWKRDGYVREIARMSELIWHVDYPPQPEEIVELTGITDAMLQDKGKAPAQVFSQLQHLIFGREHPTPHLIMAHNASFDRAVYEATCKRLSLDTFTPQWFCTIQDVPWDKKYKCKKLSHLAFDHQIYSDTSKLHRAVYDCDLLISLIFKHYDFTKIMEYYRTPWAYLKAVIPPPWQDGGVGTTQAKKLGYGWEKIFGTSLEFPKTWCKRVKETQIEAEKAKAPFKLMRLTLNETAVKGSV